MIRTLFAASALAAVVGLGLSAGTAPARADDIPIAVAGPMTGQLAAFGEQLRRGSEMAVKDINAAGGVLGKQLKLVVGDDQCDPKQAVQVANDLASEGVVFVAGHFCSGSSIPASAVYAEEGILEITPASTNPAYTEESHAKGITTLFRTCGRDDKQGLFAGPWLAKTFPGKNVAVLDDRSAYGQGLANETAKNMEANGLKPAMRENYTAGEKDFSAMISKMKAAKIDVVYIGGYHPDSALMLRQAREQGMKAQFISADATNSQEFWSISGPAGEGMRFSDASSAINLDSAKDVVAKFRADKYEPEGYTLSSYAAIQAWAAAVTKAGTTDAEKVAETLRANTIPTVIGDLGWDEKGDLKQIRYAWFLWHDGKYAQEPTN
jgi:branched-chain amino acid transport system substrate-binding protein